MGPQPHWLTYQGFNLAVLFFIWSSLNTYRWPWCPNLSTNPGEKSGHLKITTLKTFILVDGTGILDGEKHRKHKCLCKASVKTFLNLSSLSPTLFYSWLSPCFIFYRVFPPCAQGSHWSEQSLLKSGNSLRDPAHLWQEGSICPLVLKNLTVEPLSQALRGLWKAP